MQKVSSELSHVAIRNLSFMDEKNFNIQKSFKIKCLGKRARRVCVAKLQTTECAECRGEGVTLGLDGRGAHCLCGSGRLCRPLEPAVCMRRVADARGALGPVQHMGTWHVVVVVRLCVFSLLGD